jgi:hypothetical protein
MIRFAVRMAQHWGAMAVIIFRCRPLFPAWVKVI